MQREGPRLCRFYVDKTNYSIWCSKSFGHAIKGQPAAQLTVGAKAANFIIISCMRTNDVGHWAAIDKVHWVVFNEFLGNISARIESEELDADALFVLYNAPAHRQFWPVRCTQSTGWLPPYSPFFNAI